MATLFILLTLLLYTLAARAQGILKWALVGLTVASALIACGTKEIVIVLPFLIVLVEWFVVAQEEWATFAKRMWMPALFALLFGAIVVRFVHPSIIKSGLSLSYVNGNNRGNVLTEHPLDIITLLRFLMSQFRVVLHYFVIFFWPFGVSVS